MNNDRFNVATIAAVVLSLLYLCFPSQKAHAFPLPDEIADRITELTGLLPHEIDQMFAATQLADIILIPYEITIPIVREPKINYLLIQRSANGQWIRLPIETSEWETVFEPYLESLGVTVHQQRAGTIDELTPEQEATLIAGGNTTVGTETANLILYGQLSFNAVGRTQGTANVSSSGEATYSIPIVVPPGSNGLTPELSLTYSHRADESIAGVGWGLSGLSQITRCGGTTAQNGSPSAVKLVRTDRFCLDGNQLRHVSGTYGTSGSVYRTEVDLIARVTANGTAGNGPAWFKVEAKDGLIYEYGNSSNSRIESLAIGFESTARSWALSEIRDRNGNEIRFYYEEDGAPYGDYRINHILYRLNPTNGLGTPGYMIDFVYETQPAGDVDTQYGAGASIRDTKRLNRIDVWYAVAAPRRLVRRYKLNYEGALSSTGRSRLKSVQECAGSPAECLAPTAFAYSNGINGLGNEVSSGATIPGEFSPLNIDINGDGRTDLVYPSSTPTGYWVYHLANGTGYGSAVTTSISSAGFNKAFSMDYNSDGIDDIVLPYNGTTWSAILGSATGPALKPPIDTGAPFEISGGRGSALGRDLNGDGRDDLVWVNNKIGAPRGAFVRYRLPGGGFSTTATLLVGSPHGVNVSFRRFKDERSRRFDVDGDGLEDVAYFVLAVRLGIHRLVVQYGNGTGTQVAEGFPVFTKGFPIDFNGDGYTDLGLYRVDPEGDPSDLYYRVSTGVDFGPQVALPTTNIDLDNLVVIDWNSDGYEDILAPNTSTNTWYLYRSTGIGFSSPVNTGASANSPAKVFATDTNGDGLTDIGYKTAGGSFAYRPHAGPVPDLLMTVTDGNGNFVDFDYLPISDGGVYTRYSSATFPQQDYQGALHVVSTVTRSDGIGGAYETTFEYEGARRNLHGRGINGFSKRIVRDARDGSKVVETYRLDFPFRGRLARRDRILSTGTLVQRVSYTWDSLSGGSGHEDYYHAFLAQTIEKNYEGQGAYNGVQTTEITTTSEVDNYGTVYDVTVRTVEKQSGNGALPGATYTERTLLSSIANNASTWCLGKPGVVRQINSHSSTYGAQITRTLGIAWDTSARCREDSITIEPGDPKYQVKTTLGYDGFGNIASRIVTGAGMPGRVSAIWWGPTGQFPTRVTNALGHVTINGWESATGFLRSTTDPNGLTTSWQYDEFGRRRRETSPDQTYRDIVRSHCSSTNNYCGTGYPRVKSKIRVTSRGTNGSQIRYDEVYYDPQERPVETARQSLNGGPVYQRTIYDEMGRISRRSSPSFSANPAYYTTTLYDLLGRPRRVSRPVNDTTSAQQHSYIYYEGLTIRQIDAEGTETTSVLDAAGRLHRIVDDAGYYQQFDRDAFGSIRRIRDSAGNNHVTTTYDYGAGAFRRQVNDMNLGTWSFTPNAFGEVISYSDAKGQDFTLSYDKLGRTLARIETEGMTIWSWGNTAAAHNIGKLQRVSSPGNSQTFSYDVYGRLEKHTTDAEGTHEIDYGYDAISGLLESIRYPASDNGYRFSVEREYQYGLLQRVKRSDAPGTVYWEATAEDVFGNVIDATLGNGVRVIKGFDRVNGNPHFVQAGAGGSAALQNFSYSWDKVGNLTERMDHNRSLTEQFFYDDLHRLDYSRLNGVTNLNLTYGSQGLGNIVFKSDVGSGTWSYHPTKKHAVVSAGGNSYTYDANGNMTTRNGDDIAWSSFNYPVEVNEGSRVYEYAYDAFRGRWKQVYQNGAASETTYYIGGVFEKNVVHPDGTEEYRHYVRARGSIVAIHIRRETGSDYDRYVLSDYQGSVSALTDTAGATSVYENFSAFGERRDPNDWSGPPSSTERAIIAATTDLGYTAHLNLEESSLVHMGGRIFDAHIGRALSADPYIPDLMNTQAFNRYSYAYNNPMSRVDPSGFFADPVTFDVAVSLVSSAIAFFDHFFSDDPPPPNYCFIAGPNGCYGMAGSKVGKIYEDIFRLPGSRVEDAIWDGCRYCLSLDDGTGGTWGILKEQVVAEVRYGAFGTFSFDWKILAITIDIDLGSIRKDLVTGERRNTTGIYVSADVFGFGGELAGWTRSIPFETFPPGDLYKLPSKSYGNLYGRQALEQNGIRPRGDHVALGFGIGGTLGYDSLGAGTALYEQLPEADRTAWERAFRERFTECMRDPHCPMNDPRR